MYFRSGHFSAGFWLLPFCALLILGSCKKDDGTISEVPLLEFVSIAPETVVEFDAPVIITVRYMDGDGDLGENTADLKNLFVTDNRNGVEYAFRVPQLAPTGADIAITGLLPIQLENTALVNGSQAENVAYTVYVIDRAGNRSNTISTTSITVLPE